MAYEYEEVINLRVNLSQFNVGLNTAQAMFGKAKSDLDKLAILEFKTSVGPLLVDLEKAYKNVQKDIAASAREEAKELNRYRQESAKEAAAKQAELDRINSEARRVLARQEVEEQRRNDAAIAGQLKARAERQAELDRINSEARRVLARQEVEEQRRNETAVVSQLKARAEKQAELDRINSEARRALARKEAEEQRRNDAAVAAQLKAARAQELLEARELHRYRQEGLAEQARMQKQLRADAAQFASVMTPGGAPLTRSTSTTNVSAGLRAGAGIAGATGNFTSAGLLYSAANGMQMLGASTIQTTTAMTAFGAAIPVVVVGGLLAAGKELNVELAKMSTLLAGASVGGGALAARLDAAKESAVRLAGEFNISTVEVVKAFKSALSSGVEGNELERFTRQAATLSVGIGTSLDEATRILAGFKDSYQLSIGELERANDILFNTVDKGMVDVGDLITNFGRLLPIGKAAGLTLEDLAAGVAVLTRRGLTASNAVTAMTQFINGLVSPSEKAKAELDKMGIATGDAAFAGRTLVTVVEDLLRVTGGSGELIGDLFPEERAKRGASVAIDALRLLKDVRESYNDVGMAATAAERAQNTLWSNVGKSIRSVYSEMESAGSWLSDKINIAMYGSLDANVAKRAQVNAEKAELMKKYREAIGKGVTDKDELLKLTPIERTGLGGRFDPFDPYASEREYNNKKKFRQGVIEEALAKGVTDKAQETLRAVNDDLKTLDLDTRKFIESLYKVQKPLEELTRAGKRQMADRIDEKQKEYLDDLEAELEIKRALLLESQRQQVIDAEKEIQARKSTTLTPLMDELDAAKLNGDASAIVLATTKLADAEKEFAVFVKKLRDDIKARGVFKPILDEIDDINAKISTTRAAAMAGPTRSERAEKAKAEEKRDRDAREAIKEFTTIADKLYKEDVSNYEKAQRRKLRIVEDFNDKLEAATKASMQVQASLMADLADSQLAMGGDDPSARARTGKKQRDAAKGDLDALIKRGGTREEFNAALGRFRAASEAVRGATRESSAGRAERGFQEDISVAMALNKSFDRREQGGIFAERDRELGAVPNATVRSQQDIVRATLKEIEAGKVVERVQLDAAVKLQIDGTLSDKSKKELVEAVYDKIQSAQRNNTAPPSRYDNKTRNSKITAD